MRRWFIILIALCVMGCAGKAEARGYKGDVCKTALGTILNRCHTVAQKDDGQEPFDYGAYFHVILFEDEKGNFEIGNWNTYEVQRNELTSLIGIKLYLNRLTYQK